MQKDGFALLDDSSQEFKQETLAHDNFLDLGDSLQGMIQICEATKSNTTTPIKGWSRLRYNNHWSAVSPDVKNCINPSDVMDNNNLKDNKSNNKICKSGGNIFANDTSPLQVKTKSHFSFSPAQMKIEFNRRTLSGMHTEAIKEEMDVDESLVEQINDDGSIDFLSQPIDDDSINANVCQPIFSRVPTQQSSYSLIKFGNGLGTLTFSNNPAYTRLKQSQNKSDNKENSNGNAKRSRKSTSNVFHILMARKSKSPPAARRCLTPSLSIGSPASHSSSISSPSSTYSNGSGSGGTGGFRNLPFLAKTLKEKQINTIFVGKTKALNASKQQTVATKKQTQSRSRYLAELRKQLPKFPRPALSYSCLIFLALKNSYQGLLPVADIYNFMCDHFPFFVVAPAGWKNSVRHNLSLNKCFCKIDTDEDSNQRRSALWTMNPERVEKMTDEVSKFVRRGHAAILAAMAQPENFEALERGELKHGEVDYGARFLSADASVTIDSISDDIEHILDDLKFEDEKMEEEEENDLSVDSIKEEVEDFPDSEFSLRSLKSSSPRLETCVDDIDFSNLFADNENYFDDAENRMPFDDLRNIIELSPISFTKTSKRPRNNDSYLRETQQHQSNGCNLAPPLTNKSRNIAVVVQEVQQPQSIAQMQTSRLSKVQYLKCDKSTTRLHQTF